MTTSERLRAGLLAVSACVLLGGCGQTGELFLPDADTQRVEDGSDSTGEDSEDSEQDEADR